MGDGEFGLERRFLNEDDLGELFESTPLPSIACYYRWKYTGERVDEDDEERMEILRTAVRAGARAVDMVGDTFDPVPRTRRVLRGSNRVFARSRVAAQGVHDGSRRDRPTARGDRSDPRPRRRGATDGPYQNPTCRPIGLSRSRRHSRQRGADMVKIVGVDTSWDDLLETLEATVLLNRELRSCSS